MRKLLFILLFMFLCSGVNAYELDTSFDEEVRKKYNVEELNELNADKIKLPKLPDMPADEGSADLPKLPQHSYDYFPENYTGAVKVLKSGARFLVANNRNLSDTLPSGTVISFYSLEDINWKGIQIPQGTLFRGKIVQSHTPQMTGNGGLIKIEIDEFVYNNTMYKIDTVISKVDDKRIFGGKIKGKRQYLANTKKANRFGVSVNKKMVKAGRKVGQVPVIGILGVVPRAIGAVTLTGNAVVSPAVSVFKKGKHSSIPRGTVFEIKLSGDVKLKA